MISNKATSKKLAKRVKISNIVPAMRKGVGNLLSSGNLLVLYRVIAISKPT